MSTLTKVLIVLLTVFSIFLCGIVVTYVANANNQREIATGLRQKVDGAKSRELQAVKDLEDEKQTAKSEKDKLNEQITARDTQITALKGDLDTANRERTRLEGENQKFNASVALANELTAKQTDLFAAAQKEVEDLRSEQADSRKEIDESNQLLLEKMALIDQLESKVRQLTEQYQEAESRLNQYLQQYGRIAMQPATTVAPRSTTVQPMVMAPTAQSRLIGLNGKVTSVDMGNGYVEISIGTASGVRPEMKFHVIRGERVVADIRILETQPDKAVGVVSLVQPGMEPRTGDKVSTNL